MSRLTGLILLSSSDAGWKYWEKNTIPLEAFKQRWRSNNLLMKNLPGYENNYIWKFLGPGFFILTWTDVTRITHIFVFVYIKTWKDVLWKGLRISRKFVYFPFHFNILDLEWSCEFVFSIWREQFPAMLLFFTRFESDFQYLSLNDGQERTNILHIGRLNYLMIIVSMSWFNVILTFSRTFSHYFL